LEFSINDGCSTLNTDRYSWLSVWSESLYLNPKYLSRKKNHF